MNLSIFNKGLVLIGVLLVFHLSFIGLIAWMQGNYTATLRSSNHSRQVISSLHGIHRDTIEAQNAVRGFVITGDAELAEPHHRAVRNLSGDVRQLQERVADTAAAPRRRDVQRHSPGTVGRSRRATIAGRADRDEVAGHRYDDKGQQERLRSPLLAMTFGSRREPLTRGREAVPELDDEFEIAVVRNAHEQPSGKPRRKGYQVGRQRISFPSCPTKPGPSQCAVL